MCGIGGYYSLSKKIESDKLDYMARSLKHRGPDAQNVKVLPKIGLVHTRLAVLDLSTYANQPMSDRTGRYWIVYNGEIYNYKNLRDDLVKRGCQFSTKSDTEVVLQLFMEKGIDALSYLNGMFAFAIWDSKSEELFIARDRMGEKPLYYSHDIANGLFIFSSELKALVGLPDIPFEVNPIAFSQYLSLQYILGDNCIIEGVEKLPPASYILLKENKIINKGCYWALEEYYSNKYQSLNIDGACEELLELTQNSVKNRMISDVPLGTFLSGGIDSGAIAASMSAMGKPEKLKTFTIGFEHKSYDEALLARKTAQYLGMPNHGKVVSIDVADCIENIAYYSDEPFADSSIIPTYFLAKMTKQFVTVGLSGDGADEIFLGYPTYLADKIKYALGWVPDSLFELCSMIVHHVIPVTHNKVSLDYKLRQFFTGVSKDSLSAHYHWREIHSRDDKNDILSERYVKYADCDGLSIFEKFWNKTDGAHYLDRCSYTDIKTWLVDDILVKVDRATMAHSLEARTPFLDHKIVEFAARLPVSYKMKGFDKKYVLKRAYSKRLPAKLLRAKKRGFNSPVSIWIREQLAPILNELLDENFAGEFFNIQGVRNMMKEHAQRRTDHGYRLFTILMFLLWYRAFKIKSMSFVGA